MALDTYTDLQTEIVDFLNRTGDAALIAKTPTFIRLTEAEIRRRLKYESIRASLSIAAAAVDYPADMKSPRSLRLVTSSLGLDGPIDIVTPEVLAELRAQLSPTGRPQYASAIAGQFLFAPAPDQTYTGELIYYNKITPLSDVVASNEILEDAPDAYLYGALMQASPYLEHDERIPMWEAKFEKAILQLMIAKDDEEFGASLRPARIPIAF